MGKKVSVVMTTYNGQKYLREQMDSLREQTMPIDEVIIMDDCSTDHTPDLVSAYIKEYDLKGWNLVQNEQNQGWKKNFKSGFDLATGNYIFPCDQDDIWHKIKRIVTHYIDKERSFDDFTKIDFTYDNAVASIKVGMGVKSEGELIVSGTKGYIYVPAPWWKTDYFELRYENAADNRRYFYQLDGEGIRYELVAFVRAIENGRMARYIEEYVSEALSSVLSDFHNGIDVFAIKK